ncbi:DUF916 and DUF3324 domain-containing protein [Candidatus Enterococcus ikei]|uniref:DUF916 and DUF3324 domain-containing protein n=1 Tax=Candidatus Enterococcus ikei TaxID=2815326 RepID=A0ABS3GV44_9ENTE|nr:DUF916 and DUF3324 domain-containing protein [Enterococcus sp. DIV0869a]MBO0439138.1 DUF916 and DUF3324 domain-containing protein [Enterococcus sp. DIV0869a]
MKKLSITYLILIGFFTFFTAPSEAVAAKDDAGLGYTVSIVQPKTQIDPEKSYFYVKTTPGEAQTLEVRVRSTKKEPVHLNIYGSNAITGDGGTIEYAKDVSKIDKTLKEPLTSLITVETPEITVENFEEKIIHVKLTPPKESYQGVKMGALIFSLDKGSEKKSGVTTEFSYRIGVIASSSGDEFNNAQTLKLISTKAAMKRGKKMVIANLQNPEPRILENLTIEATMVEKGSEKKIKKITVQNYKLAPNSNFDFELDWGIAQLPSGDYTLKLTASNDLQEWNLSKDFTISNQQAKQINEASVFKIITPTWIKIIAAIFIGYFIAITSIMIFRRMRWEKKWKRRRFLKNKEKKKSARDKRNRRNM